MLGDMITIAGHQVKVDCRKGLMLPGLDRSYPIRCGCVNFTLNYYWYGLQGRSEKPLGITMFYTRIENAITLLRASVYEDGKGPFSVYPNSVVSAKARGIWTQAAPLAEDIIRDRLSLKPRPITRLKSISEPRDA